MDCDGERMMTLQVVAYFRGNAVASMPGGRRTSPHHRRGRDEDLFRRRERALTEREMEHAGDAPNRLFVYGSLRRGQENEMAALLHRHARWLGAGTIRARLYAISWYSGAVPSDDPGDAVHGDVFELDPAFAGEVMARLDAYEGADFARRTVEATTGETRVAAHAYLYAASVAGLPWIAHGDWLRRAAESGEVR